MCAHVCVCVCVCVCACLVQTVLGIWTLIHLSLSVSQSLFSLIVSSLWLYKFSSCSGFAQHRLWLFLAWISCLVAEASVSFMLSRKLTFWNQPPLLMSLTWVFPVSRRSDVEPQRHNTTTYIRTLTRGVCTKTTTARAFKLVSKFSRLLPTNHTPFHLCPWGNMPHHCSVSGLFQEQQSHVTVLLFPNCSHQ